MTENYINGRPAVDFVVAAITLLNPPDKDGSNTTFHFLDVQLFGEPPSRDPKDKAATDWVSERLATFLKNDYPDLFPGNIVMWAAIMEGPFAGVDVIRDGFFDMFKNGKETIKECIEYYSKHRDETIKGFSEHSVEAMLERAKNPKPT